MINHDNLAAHASLRREILRLGGKISFPARVGQIPVEKCEGPKLLSIHPGYGGIGDGKTTHHLVAALGAFHQVTLSKFPISDIHPNRASRAFCPWRTTGRGVSPPGEKAAPLAVGRPQSSAPGLFLATFSNFCWLTGWDTLHSPGAMEDWQIFGYKSERNEVLSARSTTRD